MANTSATLISWVRQLIDEQTANKYQDADIRGIMNLLLDEVWESVEQSAIDKGWLTEKAASDINLVANDDEYDIPTGFVNIKLLEVYDGQHWGRVHHLAIERYRSGVTAEDPPTHYTLLKGSFLVSPPPRQSRANALRVFGTKQPTHFTGSPSETSGLPWKCDRVIVLGTAAMILDLEGAAKAPVFQRRYENALAVLPSKLDQRHTEALDAEEEAEVGFRYPGGEPIEV